MRLHRILQDVGASVPLGLLVAGFAFAADTTPADPLAAAGAKPAEAGAENWNWHAQSTTIAQGDPGFPAAYSGPNSLAHDGQTRETVSLDLYAGVHVWEGGEAFFDGLMWQGFGLGDTRGVESFPNGEAFRLGTRYPDAIIARLFLRQTINLGGNPETVHDDLLELAGRRDASRLVFTLGKLSAKDIFDNNAYANDPRTQFMSWGLMANQAWDYPADSLGYVTGLAAEAIGPAWSVRYGFFQVPRASNGMSLDPHYCKACGMVTEFERRYSLDGHPGTARLLAYRNRADMGSYQAALDNPARPADIVATRSYRYKSGWGLSIEQEVSANFGLFSRLGWNDGRNEAWMFSDVDRTATLGASIKGAAWSRPDDTLGAAGVLNGLSALHQKFLAAGGTGILAGDGALSYGWEKLVEVYYDFPLMHDLHATIDCQFVADPAYNWARGPVSVFGARLHWQR